MYGSERCKWKGQLTLLFRLAVGSCTAYKERCAVAFCNSVYSTSAFLCTLHWLLSSLNFASTIWKASNTFLKLPFGWSSIWEKSACPTPKDCSLLNSSCHAPLLHIVVQRNNMTYVQPRQALAVPCFANAIASKSV